MRRKRLMLLLIVVKGEAISLVSREHNYASRVLVVRAKPD